MTRAWQRKKSSHLIIQKAKLEIYMEVLDKLDLQQNEAIFIYMTFTFIYYSQLSLNI